MKKLKQFLISLYKKIIELFSKIPAEFKAAVHTGVVVTENLKNFVDSPFADVLTTIIPGNVDDRIKQILRTALPPMLVSLKLADECKDNTDPNEILRCAVKVLQSLDGNIKNAYLHNISVMVTQLGADGKLSWNDALYLSQWYYQNKFKTAA